MLAKPFFFPASGEVGAPATDGAGLGAEGLAAALPADAADADVGTVAVSDGDGSPPPRAPAAASADVGSGVTSVGLGAAPRRGEAVDPDVRAAPASAAVPADADVACAAACAARSFICCCITLCTSRASWPGCAARPPAVAAMTPRLMFACPVALAWRAAM